MKILIIGGTRFFGYQTVHALVDDGHDVTIFTRGRRQPPLPDAIEHIQGDRENQDDLERAAGAADWDVVWDNMSRTEPHARGAVSAFRDRCELFLHTSTLAVYSVCEGVPSPYREKDFDAGRPMEERRGRYPYDYGLNRRAGERVLMEAHEELGFPFVTMRLPIILGPRDYSLRGWAYWRRIHEGGPLILPDGGRDMHRLIYSGDCVQAVQRILEAGPEAAGNAYNFGGREIITLRNFVERSAALMEKPLEILGIPTELLEAAAFDPDQLSPYTMFGNHLPSIAEAQHDLGFQPTPLEEWLPDTLEWHLENARDETPPGWNLRAEEGKLAARWKKIFHELT